MKLVSKMKELMKNEDGFSFAELIVLLLLIAIISIVILAVTGHAGLIKFVLGGAVAFIVLLIVIVVVISKVS